MTSPSTQGLPQLLTVHDVAGVLATDTGYVYRAFRSGRLKGIKFSHKVLRFRPSDVEAFVEQMAS